MALQKQQSQQPAGNTGTYVPPPNTYLLSQLTRANYITARRNPFTETPDALATQLQRLVHFEGNRPPNRKILFHLRLLTYYPPVPDILPELLTLLESDNAHICRQAHYHIRQLAPIRDAELYRTLLETLERQSLVQSPARRACALKTFARVFYPSDYAHASDFILDAFNRIGGARVKKPVPATQPKKFAGVPLAEKEKKDTFRERMAERAKTAFAQGSIVTGEVYENPAASNSNLESDQQGGGKSQSSSRIDDGAGGTMQTEARSAAFVKSRSGKMLVGHAALAAMRRINRVATDKARVESYIFDSGLMSVVPSTVRHTVALLEWRSTVSPASVSRYLVHRLPHKNPPENMRLYLEDLGARVYFARILSALAEDPNLSSYIPEDAPKQARKQNESKKSTLQQALDGSSYKEKASNLFNFLFNRERIASTVNAVKASASNALVIAKPVRLPRDDSLGVEFAEALINLVKNASNRVLIEALRGLSRRRWTTWFEAPIPQAAVRNAPELQDGEAYGGANNLWDSDDEADNDHDSEDENELGAYDDDIAGGSPDGSNTGASPAAKTDDKELENQSEAAEKETWFSRLNARRKERRDARIDTETPFYLRKLGQGMVPALEVILRRINVGLLHDEPVRRFSAADAVIVLSRAKMYGHTESDHEKFRKAQGAVEDLRRGKSSRALVATSDGAGNSSLGFGTAAFKEERHPFQALLRPLTELIVEDPNLYVRGRAAIALTFIIAAGAGRGASDLDDLDVEDDVLNPTTTSQETPLLLRYLRSFVNSASAGSGVGLKQMSELIDYLIYEILDVAPELAPSAIAMAEEWAQAHPTVGVCGRLGVIWEKVLSIGQGAVVGASILRAISSDPLHERVATAATIFLRRRTLDVAILTVGSAHVSGTVLPEPLPRAVGIEMEKFFSVLWHTILLGPSAECRTFAVESLGGAAVLAGEPFRICTYERSVELVRIGGFGVRAAAERVLSCLDTLYSCREQFSEMRAKHGFARGGKERSKQWLKFVWKLRGEARAAAQIALGIGPPDGWMALGPDAAADVANSERVFNADKAKKDSDGIEDLENMTVNDDGAAMGGGEAFADMRPPDTGKLGGWGPMPRTDEMHSNWDDRGRRGRYSDEYEGNEYRDSRRSDERRRRSSGENWRDDGYRRGEKEYNDRNDYRRYDDEEDMRGRRRYERDDRGYRMEEEDEQARGRVDDDVRRRRSANGSSQVDAPDRERQEAEDRALAEQMQSEMNSQPGHGENQGVASSARDILASTAGAAERLFQQGIRGGKGLTDKVMKSAARSAAMDKLSGGKK